MTGIWVPDELPEGAMLAKVTAVEAKQYENTKYGAGQRQVAVTTMSVETEDGEPCIIKYYPTVNWSPQSKWTQLLRALGVHPTKGTKLNLDELIGRQAVIIIEHVTDDDDTRAVIKAVRSMDEYDYEDGQ